LELLLPTPPISVMDPNDCLQNMEEELTQNRLKTDAIEAAFQNILAKLDAPRVNDNAMHEESSSGRAELAEEAENYGGEVESEVLGMLSRVKPATPPDFDGDRKKGRAFLHTCSIYFAICGSLFPNDQARIHWTLSYFKSDRATRFTNRVIRSVSKAKEIISWTGKPSRKPLLTSSAQRMSSSQPSPSSKGLGGICNKSD
jgi:hypothetical protein